MNLVETMSAARIETIEEMSGLLFVIQEMGTRLANETHGAAFDLVRELNELLHQAHATVILIKQGG